MLHRARDLLVRQRTMLVNALRGHLGEFGIVAANGIQNISKLLCVVADYDDERLPAVARDVLDLVIEQPHDTTGKINALEKRLVAWHRSNEANQRLAAVPGIGPITATTLIATVGDPKHFKSARQFSAWLGLTPQEHSSGGKSRPGRISKRGDAYVRRLLVHGARTVVRWHKNDQGGPPTWLGRVLSRRPKNVAIVALANKNARIVWALMMRQETFVPIR